MKIFLSKNIKKINFTSQEFNILLQNEQKFHSKIGWTTLMALCKCAPQLLKYNWAMELVKT